MEDVFEEGPSGFVAGVDVVPPEFRKEEKALIFASLLAGICTACEVEPCRKSSFVVDNPQSGSEPATLLVDLTATSSYPRTKGFGVIHKGYRTENNSQVLYITPITYSNSVLILCKNHPHSNEIVKYQ